MIWPFTKQSRERKARIKQERLRTKMNRDMHDALEANRRRHERRFKALVAKELGATDYVASNYASGTMVFSCVASEDDKWRLRQAEDAVEKAMRDENDGWLDSRLDEIFSEYHAAIGSPKV